MSAMNEKDYYEVLGVDKDASTDDIRRAFQKKARTLHPDVNKEPDAEERFKEVSEAYAVLSDDAKRKRYDAMRSGNPFAAAGSGGYGGYGPAGYGGAEGWPFGGMGGWPFGGAASTRSSGRAYKPRAGADIVIDVELTAEQAKAGCHRGITYNRYVPCESCDGKGTVHSEQSCTCPMCGGSGHMTIDLGSILGFGAMSVVCPECEGEGRVVSNPCSDCGGSGRKLSASEITVDIPAGSHDGDEVRVEERGNAGTNGSSSGAFVARVVVESERLKPGQASSLSTIGFCLPFVILNIVQRQVGILTFIIALALGMSVYSFFRRGGFGSGLTWWKNAGRAVLGGVVNGAIFALFAFFMFRCSAGMTRQVASSAQHVTGIPA